jgi:hypothetical protein
MYSGKFEQAVVNQFECTVSQTLEAISKSPLGSKSRVFVLERGIQSSKYSINDFLI